MICVKKNRTYIAILIILALVAGGTLAWSRLAGRTPETALELPDGREVEVTPVDRMRTRTAETAPVLEAESYRLAVSGMVDNPLGLTLAELQAFPAAEEIVDLPCVEGWTETGLWRGPRLRAVLDKAGVQPGADNVVFSSPGGYTTSLTLADIDETDPILAYGVNGETLPARLGFPIRLVVPHRLGYKWAKWVTGIQVIRGDYRGYWESRGYSNEAETER